MTGAKQKKNEIERLEIHLANLMSVSITRRDEREIARVSKELATLINQSPTGGA